MLQFKTLMGVVFKPHPHKYRTQHAPPPATSQACIAYARMYAAGRGRLAACIHGGFPGRWCYIVQLLYTTFLCGYFDSRVPRPIDGNKRRFPRGPTSRILSLEPELLIVDSSHRPSREARSACVAYVKKKNRKFQINSNVSPCIVPPR